MMFDIKTPFKSNGWKRIKVKNNTNFTHYTLKNGTVIPTWKEMMRLAYKSGK